MKIINFTFIFVLLTFPVYSQEDNPLKEFAERFYDLYLKKNLIELDKTHPFDVNIRLIVKQYYYKKHDFTLQVELFKTYKELADWLTEKKLWGLEKPPKLFCYKDGVIFFSGDMGINKVLCSKNEGRYYVDTILMEFR